VVSTWLSLCWWKSSCAKRGNSTWIPPMEWMALWMECVTMALTSLWKQKGKKTHG